VKGDISAITAQTVVEAWRNEDEVATAIMEDTIAMLTVWFGNIIDVLEPHVIVVGGGLGNVTSEWFLQIQHGLEKWSLNPRAQEIPFRVAKFGVDAGIVGAGALCYVDSSPESKWAAQRP
jgi:predicted NBD/HSP70 family sugar kinase